MTQRDTIPAVSRRDRQPAAHVKARVRVTRHLGRHSGARLTIDHLVFDITDQDCEQLAAQLVRVLAARVKEQAKERADEDDHFRDVDEMRRTLAGKDEEAAR
jgi:hypothetical protein